MGFALQLVAQLHIWVHIPNIGAAKPRETRQKDDFIKVIFYCEISLKNNVEQQVCAFWCENRQKRKVNGKSFY